LEVVAGRILRRRARLNLRAGFPQLTTYTFDYVGLEINVPGRYEGDLLQGSFDFLMDSGFKFEGIAIDIGSQIGNHAWVFAQFYPYVIAFEPNPRSYELLTINVRGHRVQAHQLALGNQINDTRIRDDRFNSGGSRVIDLQGLWPAPCFRSGLIGSQSGVVQVQVSAYSVGVL